MLQSLSAREATTEQKVLGTFRLCSLSLPSRNTLHADQVALTIHLKLHPTIVNALILRGVNAPKQKHKSSLETIVVRIASATEENYGLWKFIF